MTELRSLWIYDRKGIRHHSMSGTLPSTISGMKKLQSIALWNLEISGTLPAELGKMSHLSCTSRGERTGERGWE